MKRRNLIVLMVIMTVLLVQPLSSSAASLDSINKQLSDAKKAIDKAQKEADATEQQKTEVSTLKSDVQASIKAVLAQLDAVVINMNNTQAKVDQTESELQQAGAELVEAEGRVKTRDILIQQRLRLMYENGSVSYLDVLLNASSFSDFIDRFDSLQLILSQDRSILEQNKVDQALVEEKKAEVEQKLEEVKTMYTKLQNYQSDLAKKEAQKNKLVAEYDHQLEDLEDISAEQEALMIEFAQKVSELEAEKVAKLEAERIAREKAAAAAAAQAGTGNGSSGGGSGGAVYTGGKLGMPIFDSYRVSSGYGYRIHPITGAKKLHTGIDFAAPQGTAIHAAESGVVILAQRWSGYGNAVIIDHGGGMWTLYGHIREGGIKVSKGDSVTKGQKIAEVGSTGNSTGPHLHFEVRINGTTTDPSSYLK
ncbi:Peptidase family M23 [Paenibacillus algorifonticola]|uniref:Peptidase family M23 n=1 Tax=Paenibacillus algorifonticola TaxID=684063 RepID=A0A1I2IVE2_9BACL|nr:M23 family metallopeptidase [Paenibacillus algorifonticola]SFF46365.1 Peptidase family M23 [Paenibacillus algorifonticola]